MFGNIGDADIEFMLRDAGVPVSYTRQGLKFVGNGIVDFNDATMLTGESATFAGKTITVTLRAADFPGVAEGQTLTVDGTDYLVVSVMQQDDGALSHVIVAR